MELKQERAFEYRVFCDAFNRTSMELKQELLPPIDTSGYAFNRTSMELKPLLWLYGMVG